MSTFVNFAPSTAAAFQFQAILDGQAYNVVVTWLLFGRRFYVNVYSLGGALVVSQPLISSPTGQSLGSLAWAGGKVQATTLVPHGLRVGSVVALTIAGASPDAYNGLQDCLVTGPSSFSYTLATNPGAASVFGTAAFNINLVGGQAGPNGTPFTSTLVFREAAQQFEVHP